MNQRVDKVEESGRLSDGMSIIARVRARILGMKLIEIDADIQVAPRKRLARLARTPSVVEIEAGPSGSNGHARNDRRPGEGLAVAAEALRNGAGDLADAKRQMP